MTAMTLTPQGGDFAHGGDSAHGGGSAHGGDSVHSGGSPGVEASSVKGASRALSDAAERLAFFRDGQCIPAIPLCLNADRTFDPEGQRRLIRYYLEAGVGGIAVAVHTTQFAIRDPEHDLLEPVLRLTAETIDDYQASAGRTVLKVAGVCGPVAQAREEARLAASLGYDLQLLSIGGLEDHDEAALLDRTRAVADILPVIGFSMQVAVGGRLFSDAYWEGMMAIPGVVGVKAAPFDRYETIKIARAAALSDREDPPVLYTGNDDHIVVDLLTPFAFKDQDRKSVV